MKAATNDRYCIPCMKNIRCDHQGIADVCGTESHKIREKQVKCQPSRSVSKLFESKGTPARAEVVVTNFLIQPLATSDHLGGQTVILPSLWTHKDLCHCKQSHGS